MAEFNNELFSDGEQDLENFVSKDAENETTHENVVKKIFATCDESKTGFVAVSKIIEFIAPYMDHNEEQLTDLRQSLDPHAVNPLITKGIFLKSMREWTEKCCETNSNTESRSTPTRNSTEFSSSENQLIRISTPSRESLGTDFIPIFKVPEFNMSSISNYSFTGSTAGGVDFNVLQEQINELQHQNKKLNEMLSEVRNQLILSEEQNSTLQNDVDRLTRRLQSEQKVNEMYQIERKEHEEYRENTDNILKRYEHVNQNLLVYKKENAQYKQDIEDLERENRKLTETITQLRNKESMDGPKIEQLKIDIAIRDKEIESLEENNRALLEKCRQREKDIQNHIDKVEHLKYENKTLEKRLGELIKRADTSITRHKELNKTRESIGNASFPDKSNKSLKPDTPFAPPIEVKKFKFYNFDSPYTRMINKRTNSPNFIKMINNPITPFKSTDSEKSESKSSNNNNNKKNISKIPIYPFSNLKSIESVFTSSPNKSDSDLEYKTPMKFTPRLLKSVSTDSIFPGDIYQNESNSLNVVHEGVNERLAKSLSNENDELNVSYELDYINTDRRVSAGAADLSKSSCDDEIYWRSVVSQVAQTPHESLQSELQHAPPSTSEAQYQICCDHNLKLIQSEHKIKTLELKLKEHEKCYTESELKRQEITKLQEKIKKMYKDADRIKQELETTKRHNLSASEKSSKYEDLFHKTKDTVKELEDIKNFKDAEIHKLKSKEQNMKEEFGKLKSAFDQMKQDYNNLTKDAEIYRKERKKARDELRAAQKSQDEFLNRCKQLNKDIENLKIDAERLQAEKEQLIADNKYLEEQCKLNEKNVSKCNLELSNMRNDNIDVNNNMEILRKKISELTKNLDKSKEENIEKEEKLKKMDNLIIVLASLEEQNEKYKIKYKDSLRYVQEAKEIKDKCDVLQNELEEKNKINDDITIELSTIRLEMHDIKDMYEKELTEWKELGQKLKDEKNKIIKDSDQLKIELNKIKQTHQEEIDEKNKTERELKDNMNKVIKEAQDLRYETIKQKQKHEAEVYENNKMERELKDNINQMKKETMELKNQISILKKEHDEEISEKNRIEKDSKDKISKLLTDFKDLEQELQKLQLEKTENEKNYICERCAEFDKELLELKNARADTDERSAKMKIDKRSTRREVLNYRIDKLDEQLGEEKDKTKMLQSQLCTISLEKVELEKKIKELDDEKEIILADKEAQLTKSKKLSQTIESLELKILASRQQITDLNEKISLKVQLCSSLHEKLNESENKFSKHLCEFNNVMSDVNMAIMEQMQILGGQTLSTVDTWRVEIENFSPESPLLTDCQEIQCYSDDRSADQSEISLLDCQVNHTVILLKTLNKLKEVRAEKSNINNLSHISKEESVAASFEEEPANPRKHFILRPPILILKASEGVAMSPDSPSEEMNDISSRIVTKLPLELNNNTPQNIVMGRTQINSIDSNLKNIDEVFDNRDEGSIEEEKIRDIFPGPQGDMKIFPSSESSVSSDTDSTESLSLDMVLKPEEEVRRLSAGGAAIQVEEGLPREVRSMSEGAANIRLNEYGDITVFPSLQDSILENMGLLGDGPRDHLTEEEIEAKFQTLTLAFTIDAVTLADRRQRQMRQRDQAEYNMKTEIERLIRAIHRLNPLCVDAEKTELVTSLLRQLDVIDQAATRISTAAEVFGSVQQEWRLSDSFNLILNHLRNLKTQRDTARRQLQCTKRMLQESTETPSVHAGRLRTLPISNGKLVTRRRASIAAIQRPTDAKLVGTNSPERRLPRRTSAGCAGEVSPRLWERTLRRRLELGDLGKIREGTVESALSPNCEEQSESETEPHDYKTPSSIPEITTSEFEFDEEPLAIRRRIARKLQRIGSKIEQHWNTLAEEGTIHEFCCLGAILCFAMSTIILGNLMIEMEYSKRGVPVQKIPWAWITFEELFAPFVRINYPNGPPPY